MTILARRDRAIVSFYGLISEACLARCGLKSINQENASERCDYMTLDNAVLSHIKYTKDVASFSSLAASDKPRPELVQLHDLE